MSEKQVRGAIGTGALENITILASQDLGVCVLQHCVGLRRRTLGDGLGDRINPNNQKFHDNRGWEIGRGFGDIWKIGKIFGDRISLNNKKFCDNGGWDIGRRFGY